MLLVGQDDRLRDEKPYCRRRDRKNEQQNDSEQFMKFVFVVLMIPVTVAVECIKLVNKIIIACLER